MHTNHWSDSNHHHSPASVMGSTSSPDLQQTRNANITTSSNPSSCAITIDSHVTHITKVDILELESCTRRAKHLELALKTKGAELTDQEIADVERRVDASELALRVAPRSVTIASTAGGEESVSVSLLPHSYQHIRNLLWIAHQPVYRTALAEWRRQLSVFGCRVERKIMRSDALRNEIYNVLGFYSVFQGVLFTATSQSNYLHCQNVGFPVAFSACASLCTLVHISRKFRVIAALERTICSEEIFLKEVKSRILALKERGDAFRFSDFLEDKEITGNSHNSSFHIFGLKRRFLVPTTIFIFSVVLALSHWLILCHPGHKVE